MLLVTGKRWVETEVEEVEEQMSIAVDLEDLELQGTLGLMF